MGRPKATLMNKLVHMYYIQIDDITIINLILYSNRSENLGWVTDLMKSDKLANSDRSRVTYIKGPASNTRISSNLQPLNFLNYTLIAKLCRYVKIKF